MRVIVVTCLAMIGLAASNFAFADDHEEAESPNAGIEVPIPEELKDEAFDEYVDLGELADAWRDMDHVALADIAEKLAAGERKLNRSHKVGCSKTILMRAARAAAQRGDKEELERIIALFKQPGPRNEEGNKEGFLLEVSGLRQVVGNTRTATEPVMVNANEVSGSTLDAYHDTLERIEAAKIVADSKSLEQMSQHLSENAEMWPESLRNTLTQAIDEARSTTTEPNASEEMLNKLIGDSRVLRYWNFRNTNHVNSRWLEYQPSNSDGDPLPGTSKLVVRIRPRKTGAVSAHAAHLHVTALGSGNTRAGSSTCIPSNYKIVRKAGSSSRKGRRTSGKLVIKYD